VQRVDAVGIDEEVNGDDTANDANDGHDDDPGSHQTARPLIYGGHDRTSEARCGDKVSISVS
jgi:hypothetical protein